MSQSEAFPLVTFFVIAYKQERHVREAVESAFAQTYQPLEIILSDDCSPDGTFGVMKEMAAAYEGPHQVVLNRNPQNLGLVRHLERIMELSRGEFVVQNAGDDVSEPQRAERLVAIWLASGRKAKLVHSPALSMNEEGVPLGIRHVKPLLKQNPTPFEVVANNLTGTGAMYGWSRDLFDAFGGLGPELFVEDFCLTYRAAATGGIRFVDEPLVRKRVGGLSVTKRHKTGRDYLYGTRLKHLRWDAGNRRQFLKDLERLSLPETEAAACRTACLKRLDECEFEIGLAEAGLLRRFARLSDSMRRSLSTGRLFYVRQNLKYLLERLYVPYLDLRNRNRENPVDDIVLPPPEILRS